MVAGGGGLLLAVYPQLPRQFIVARATDAPGGHGLPALWVSPVALDKPLDHVQRHLKVQRVVFCRAGKDPACRRHRLRRPGYQATRGPGSVPPSEPRFGASPPRNSVTTSTNRPNCWTSSAQPFPRRLARRQSYDMRHAGLRRTEVRVGQHGTPAHPSSGTGKALAQPVHQRPSGGPARATIVLLGPAAPFPVPTARRTTGKNKPARNWTQPAARYGTSAAPARCHSNRKQPPATSSVTDNRSGGPPKALGPLPRERQFDCPSGEDTAISAATCRAACLARSRPASQARPACR